MQGTRFPRLARSFGSRLGFVSRPFHNCFPRLISRSSKFSRTQNHTSRSDICLISWSVNRVVTDP